MILPNRLYKGDTVGIIAPASPPNREQLERGIAILRQQGLHIKLGKHISSVYGYLAGTDAERLEDLHMMFQDTSVKAIICACGGYGTARLVDGIDIQLIRQNPKIFWGYSDITYLHTAIRQRANLVTFHGPMVASDIGKENFDALSEQMFCQLFTPTNIVYNEAISPLQTMSEGEATGALVGGNLTLLTSTLGTEYEIETKAKLLLIEDVGEDPYRVDAMLNQLRLAGKLHDAAGIVIGSFTKVEPPTNKPSFDLDQVLTDYMEPLHIPVMKGFNIGHCMPNIGVPLGVTANLSSKTKTLTIHPAVK
ncbi:LD-carboxypeptidase [Radiobacillus sp. PE A8.2]|uniref:S66 peptidase family protein n=1 Tax=Radiobacillus sp. PE A8.2 TaxID=3380349 RepID=UPI00388DF3DA